MMNLSEWMKSGWYLPPILRDFHDQKTIFKTMHEIVGENEADHRPSWIDGQIYVIDVFLWFMALRGYTLQRSRQRLEFINLDSDLKAAEKRRNEELAAIMAHYRMNTNEEAGDGGG